MLHRCDAKPAGGRSRPEAGGMGGTMELQTGSSIQKLALERLNRKELHIVKLLLGGGGGGVVFPLAPFSMFLNNKGDFIHSRFPRLPTPRSS